MWKKVCCGIVPVCCLLLGFLAAGAVGGEGEGKKGEPTNPKKKEFENCEGSPKVCPVFYWGFFGGFHQHMGYRCDTNTTVGLASTYKMPICNCKDAACVDKCINVGFWENLYREKTASLPVKSKAGKGKRLANSIQYTHDYLEGGTDPREKALEDREVIQSGTGFTAKVVPGKDRFVAKLYLDRNGTRWVYAALHTIKVIPDDQITYSTKIIPTGYQVKTGPEIVIIPWNKITKERNGKVCLVEHGGYDYCVVLGRETEDPDE
jgi:hypothetical protein